MRLGPACRCLALNILVGCSSSTPIATPSHLTSSPSIVSPPEPARAGSISPADIQAMVRSLDANPDPLHADVTPAVLTLAGLGLVGARAVVDRLDSTDRDTRMHAQRVVEYVVEARNGFRIGRGYPDGYGEARSRALLLGFGYSYESNSTARRAAMERIRTWLETQPANPEAYRPPDGPSRAEMLTALVVARAAIERCGQPLDVTVQFERSGHVDSIWPHFDADAAFRGCLSRAVATVRLPPFQREHASVVLTSDTSPTLP